MSKLLHAKADREVVIDMLFSVVQKLTFHGINQVQQRNIAMHFFNIRERGTTLDVDCRLDANPSTGETILRIAMKPVGENGHTKTN